MLLCRGHGLHTTAPEVLQSLKTFALERNNLFSIHLAESEAETEFLSSGRGIWADFLASRGIDFSHWDLTSERPVQRALRLGLLGAGTLAVHLLQATRAEWTALSDTGTSVCLCPRSNFLLHNRLPDIKSCLAAGLAPALGTDSLASSPTLSLFDEMAFITEQYADLAPDTLLAFATINGAKALARTDLGTVEPGRRARSDLCRHRGHFTESRCASTGGRKTATGALAMNLGRLGRMAYINTLPVDWGLVNGALGRSVTVYTWRSHNLEPPPCRRTPRCEPSVVGGSG